MLPQKFFFEFDAVRWLLRLFWGPKHFTSGHHGDKCPSAVLGTPHERVAHASQSEVCLVFSLIVYSKQRWLRMCDHCTLNLLILRSPQLSFTSRLYICAGMDLYR